jgi:murein DD-endopeptidase MepM/ murein hydrolase activator NlpD
MVRDKRIWQLLIFRHRLAVSGSVLTFVALLSGCSADISRLDFQGVGSGAGGNSASIPIPSEPVGNYAGAPTADAGNGWPNSGPRTNADGRPVPSSPARGVKVASLEASMPAATTTYPTRFPEAPSDRKPARLDANTPYAGGEVIEVQQGDTLYTISKRYRVSISALMDVNFLKNPNLKPGQKLVLPATVKTRTPLARGLSTRTAGVATPPLPAAQTQSSPAAATPAFGASYTIKAGDSLYAIARAHNISLSELQRVNGISDATKVRVGVVLKVPGDANQAPTSAPGPVQTVASGGENEPPHVVQIPANNIRIINGVALQPDHRSETNVAAGTDTANDADSSGAKFRWPAMGKIIAEFGKRPDGTHNDGINVAVPQGTDVHAAEAGTIAYAGSELKGYGNLILVRHNNGWVSAYAHNEQILVNRGDAVKRGQVIAKAGKTGTVDQPQIHFELRQGSKPVDPLAYMEKI